MNALTEAFARSETGFHSVARSDLLISCRGGPLEQVLLRGGLYAVFQPIVHLGQAHVYAHEALIRGPRGSPLHTPDALLRAAAEEGLGFEFEYACVRVALQTWAQCKTPGRLFINLSAGALMQLSEQSESLGILQRLQDIGLTPRMLVIEITEHERVVDMDQLGSVVHKMRAMGIALALDDFGDGRSSLRLWSQLKPEVVKIDKYFTKDISAHGDKLKTLQALQQIAILFGSELVAEGIETAHDLRVLRDLGMDYGQGYYLGHPASEPLRNPGVDTERVLKERQVVVFPELSRVEASGQLRHLSLVTAPTVCDSTTVDEVARIFMADLSLHAVAVLADGKPVGIVNRSKFMNEYTKLYYREIWGRRSCAVHTNYAPRIIEREHCISDLIGILTSQDQRYLSDGFIVTENGRYIGLGTGDQLVRSVTESRVEAARHANPLTFLPGNIPISQHIDRLLKKQVSFVACYADLNHFKPFNDYYGYWRGDEMICMLARIAKEQCDAQLDFLGHVGGDDFLLLFQSVDWQERCENIVRDFNALAFDMFDPAARSAGGIQAEDRHGVHRFFPCTTLSIGAASIEGGAYTRAEDVANLAAVAKHQAKVVGTGLHVLKR